MRVFALMVAVSLLLAGCSGRPGTATTYGPRGLLGGYSERMIEPGIWRITAHSNGIAERGFGRDMAVYRAAELVRARGFSHLQLLDQDGVTRSVGTGGSSMSYAGESLTVTVRGVNDPAEPLVCRAKVPSACMTLSAETVMASVGPRLTFRKPKAAKQD